MSESSLYTRPVAIYRYTRCRVQWRAFIDNRGGPTMRILEEALTFDDVLLVPAFSDFLPRDADL
ncbi:MAG TPA: hypothetical protein VFS47_01355, partial [Steroidobacteraceae bacterium]|nr:hypothetical protein [Steroidobacteraceae bacterium]